MKRVPPLLTPFAILTICLALGATNVVTNTVTHTQEGAKVTNTNVPAKTDPKQDTPDDQNKDTNQTKDTGIF